MQTIKKILDKFFNMFLKKFFYLRKLESGTSFSIILF